MLQGSGLLFPGPFLPYPGMPSHLNAINFSGKFICLNTAFRRNILSESHHRGLGMGKSLDDYEQLY